MEQPQPGARRWGRAIWIVTGLALTLLANYYLRHTLEESPRRMYSFMETFYGPQIPAVLAKSWWQLLLPIPEFTGAWATSTMLLTYALERRLTSGGVWELYNAIAILVAFGTTWTLFRSAVFSFTFAIAIGFGTQFYHAYAVTGGIASYIVATYHLLLLFSAVQIVRGATPRVAWWAALAGSLALNMLGYEGWLDVLAVVWVAAPVAYLGLRRLGRADEARRVLHMVAAMTAAGIGYIVIKVTLGFGQAQGAESDIIFNYASTGLMIEDLVANVFTHTYLSVSNFLPPFLVGATSGYWLGVEQLVSAQHGYHEQYLYLVAMNQVFFWRFYAGAVLVSLLYVIARTAARLQANPSAWTLALMMFLLMILVPGATHTLVKFRPMNAMPAMTYHVTVGVIGAAGLIAWLVTTAWRSWPNRAASGGVIAVVWLLLLYGALARPPYLAYMAAQSGLGSQIYPNPLRALSEVLGVSYQSPSGMLAYPLMPFRHDDGVATARGLLAALPNALPPIDQWQAVTGQASAPARQGGIAYAGDDTQTGYQVMSPPIPLAANATYLVRVKFEVTEGRVCAGILTADQQRWLVPPDGVTAELSFQSGAVDAMRVVLANCYPLDSGNPASRFRVTGGSFARLAEGGVQP